ncbi:MAG TPA: transglycosylase SLT domain-containing protein [Aquella sp.]|nr:transglycosylase SLT domain-containing protein [Aquella sp.]
MLILAIMAVVGVNSANAATQVMEALANNVQTSLHDQVLNPIRPHLVFNNKDKADAWLKDMSNRLGKWLKDDEYLKTGYLTIIQYEAARANLDPQVVLSLITVESRFNNFAVSSAGAIGLMQIMPFWQLQIGTPEHNLFDVQTNLRYGCTILRYYLQREDGDLDRALARYNGSIGKTWYPELVKQAYNSYWTPYPVMTMKNNKVITIDYTN